LLSLLVVPAVYTFVDDAQGLLRRFSQTVLRKAE